MKRKNWLNDARFTTWRLDFSDLAWPNPQLTTKWRHRAETFQKLGVNSVVFYGFHLRWDYLSILNRVLGILREITDICHDHALKVVEHHSTNSVHRIRSEEDRRAIHSQNRDLVPFYPDSWSDVSLRGKEMPTWRQISARDSKPVFCEQNRSEIFCPNHPSFQKASLELIDRHLEAVPFDAILSDDPHFLPDVYSCACTHCKRRFTDETGFELPSPDDSNFWENRKNPAFLEWVSARYRWNADHSRRLRNHLPSNILLLGSASRSLSPDLAETGTSPQLFSEHWDAIVYKIPSAAQWPEISSETAAFNSIARYYRKPLILLSSLDSPDQLSSRLNWIKKQDARPWISKQIQQENPIPEENLLEHGFDFPKTTPKKPTVEPIQAVVFSEKFRDSLEPAAAENYVEECKELCADLVARGSRPFLVFDNMWNGPAPALWECLWAVDSRALDDPKQHKIENWQKQGLAIGIA